MRRGGTERGLKALQKGRVTGEPAGRGLLWRLGHRGPEPQWPREGFARRVAELLPEQVLLDDAMSLEFWDLTFRAGSDTFVQTNYSQMLVLYRTALDMLGAAPADRVLDL